MFHPKYRPEIDGLRAIAVLSVIAFHVFPEYVTGGFIGVGAREKPANAIYRVSAK